MDWRPARAQARPMWIWEILWRRISCVRHHARDIQPRETARATNQKPVAMVVHYGCRSLLSQLFMTCLPLFPYPIRASDSLTFVVDRNQLHKGDNNNSIVRFEQEPAIKSLACCRCGSDRVDSFSIPSRRSSEYRETC